ncbi:MAG: response regulator transcription factor [Flavobacteriales bacterium]|nr:response regulator transcription factor [Flavobacteriales bacterium]
MEVLIIEDEFLSAERLKKLVLDLDRTISIIGVIDSVEDAVNWFENNSSPDLVFLDIHLADGSSFEIFEKVEIKAPIIFTTAYDKYAIKAFKVDSIDYLLKPIDKVELEKAVEKYKKRQKRSEVTSKNVKEILDKISPSYKDRFMVKSLNSIISLKTYDIAYFYSEDKLSFIKTKQGKKHVIDYSLDQLTELISPKQYFRVNRKIIINIDAIEKMEGYLNSRLLITTNPAHSEIIVVSREKVSAFKKWLDS